MEECVTVGLFNGHFLLNSRIRELSQGRVEVIVVLTGDLGHSFFFTFLFFSALYFSPPFAFDCHGRASITRVCMFACMLICSSVGCRMGWFLVGGVQPIETWTFG